MRAKRAKIFNFMFRFSIFKIDRYMTRVIRLIHFSFISARPRRATFQELPGPDLARHLRPVLERNNNNNDDNNKLIIIIIIIVIDKS